MRVRVWSLAAACLAAAGAVRAEDCNRQAFEAGQACHAMSRDAGPKPGPQLIDVLGRPVGGDPAFDYSPVLQAARRKGEIWTKERLDEFLRDPEVMYPGTWMGSPPIRDDKMRADLLCVLGNASY
jgi:cytochrome c